MSDGTYDITNDGVAETNIDENHDDIHGEDRSRLGLKNLLEYVRDPTNHLKKYEEEVSKLLQSATDELEQVTVQVNVELEQKITDLEKRLTTSESNQKRYRNERNDLKRRLEQERNQKHSVEQDLQFRYEQKEGVWAKRLRDSEDRNDEIIRDYKSKIGHIEKDIRERDQKIADLEDTLEKSRSDFTNRDELEKKLEESQKQLNETNDRLNEALTKADHAEKEHVETKTRISGTVSDKLTGTNPNVAGLDDENRPINLADRYAELYDNQWKGAFETIERYFESEEDVVKALLEILQNVMEFCETQAKRQMENLQKSITCSDDQADEHVPDNIMKQLKDIRQAASVVSREHLYKSYLSSLRESTNPNLKHAIEIEAFVKECFEICWLMVIQEPPNILSPMAMSGEALNTDIYKPYTSSGTHIQYVVWPALLLHEDGAVLVKGVAEGNNDELKKSKKAGVGNAGMSNGTGEDLELDNKQSLDRGRFLNDSRYQTDNSQDRMDGLDLGDEHMFDRGRFVNERRYQTGVSKYTVEDIDHDRDIIDRGGFVNERRYQTGLSKDTVEDIDHDKDIIDRGRFVNERRYHTGMPKYTVEDIDHDEDTLDRGRFVNERRYHPGMPKYTVEDIDHDEDIIDRGRFVNERRYHPGMPKYTVKDIDHDEDTLDRGRFVNERRYHPGMPKYTVEDIDHDEDIIDRGRFVNERRYQTGLSTVEDFDDMDLPGKNIINRSTFVNERRYQAGTSKDTMEDLDLHDKHISDRGRFLNDSRYKGLSIDTVEELDRDRDGIVDETHYQTDMPEDKMEELDLGEKHVVDRGRFVNERQYQTSYLSGYDHGRTDLEGKRYTMTSGDRYHRSESAEEPGVSYAQSTVATQMTGTSSKVLNPSARKDKRPTRDEMRQYLYHVDRGEDSKAIKSLGYEAYIRCHRNEHKRHLYS